MTSDDTRRDEASVSFETVLATELQHVIWRRARISPTVRKPQADEDEEDDPGDTRVEGDAAAVNAHRLKPLGLGFSGGGIRSATFNLGILQGLAELDLLRRVDYLSTVSGGGYIGSWLHGFIKHHCDSNLIEATRRLSPTIKPVEGPATRDPIAFLRKYSNYLAPSPGLFSADTWVIGVIWLRNVLLNQLILLPALAVPMLLASLAVFGQIKVKELTEGGWVSDTFHISAALLAAIGLLVAACGAAINLRPIVRRTLPAKTSKGGPGWWQKAKNWFEDGVNAGLRRPLRYLVVPLLFLVAAILGCTDLGRGSVSARLVADPMGFGLLVLAMFACPYFVLGWGGGFLKYYGAMHGKTTRAGVQGFVYLVLMSLAAAALSAWLLHEVLELSRAWAPWSRVAFVPVLVCLAVQVGITLLVGLMGADYPDGAREWVARVGTGLLLLCTAWLALFAVAIWGPWAVAWSLANYGKTTLTVLTGWIATSGLGVLAGRSPASGGVEQEAKPASGRIVALLVAVAPTVFMIGYLLLISLGVHKAVDALLDIPMTPAVTVPAPPSRLRVDVTVPEATTPIEISVNRSGELSTFEGWLAKAGVFADSYFNLFALPVATGAAWLTLFVGVCAGIVALASRRININEFSLHHFYKNRLVRCYLGASHGEKRQPNPLTGFDPRDDFALSELRSDDPATATTCNYTGPYPIVNTTLNVNVGAELAQQERKGASFVFTPAYCGFAPWETIAEARTSWLDRFDKDGGYHRTAGGTYGYSAPEGPTVGQVMAISGAAANPNSGYATTGAMAFLLTVFDARLGWWLGNPRWRKASSKPGPSFALGALLSELFAQTTARSKFVNLSDGGHFDNLGLYELVRRRCRYIIIGDGEQDGDLTFGSLGGAIRKCRADFGVEIDIDPHPIRLKNGRSTAHCVVGTITYPEIDPVQPEPMTGQNVDPDEDGDPNTKAGQDLGAVKEATGRARGWLLYLKSSLTGNEPADVIEYQSRNPDFPHQSTGDQFFSESQFESYRRLGLHVLREAFEGVQSKVGEVTEWKKPPVADASADPAASVAAATHVPVNLLKIFQQLTTKWYPPIPVPHDQASRLNDRYSEMVKRLSDSDLVKLLPTVLADPADPAWPAGTAKPGDKEFVYAVEQIGLMENVFFEFGFEHAANRANPRNRGWMKVFRQWVANDQFYKGMWPRVRNSYNPVFQRFIDQLHTDKIDDVPIQN